MGVPAQATTERATEHIYPSWDHVLDLSAKLATEINEHCVATGERYDSLLALPRGGYYVTMVLSRMFKIEAPALLSMSLTSYAGNATEASGFRYGQEPTEIEVYGRNILVPDDVFDTGKTEAEVKKILLAKGAASVSLAALYEKPENRAVEMEPDFVIEATTGNTWIHFPWEELEGTLENPSVFSGLGYSALSPITVER